MYELESASPAGRRAGSAGTSQPSKRLQCARVAWWSTASQFAQRTERGGFAPYGTKALAGRCAVDVAGMLLLPFCRPTEGNYFFFGGVGVDTFRCSIVVVFGCDFAYFSVTICPVRASRGMTIVLVAIEGTFWLLPLAKVPSLQLAFRGKISA